MPTTEKQSKSIKGGARQGAGRKPGVRNKKTAALIDAVEKSGITPLDYMLSVMRDVTAEPKDRMTAAQGAAPYSHSKLASIEVSGKDGGAIEHSLKVAFVGVTP